MRDDVNPVITVSLHMVEVEDVTCCSSLQGRVNGCVLSRRYSIFSIELWVLSVTHIEMRFLHAEARIPTVDDLQIGPGSFRVVVSLHLSHQLSTISVAPSGTCIYGISV
jgi:hypothetical protein